MRSLIKKMIKLIVTVALIAGFIFPQPILANDDVLTVIEEALQQYKNGDLSSAANNLDYASQLIRQKKSEKLKSVLPKPIPGWDVEPATSQAIGTAVFGGGVTVSQAYRKGPSHIIIEIISDSPVLQSVMMMLNSPVFAGASGGKLEIIKGQRAIVKFEPEKRDGEINVVIANKFMVTVKGQEVTREELLAYTQLIDFQVLSDS